ncbi:MAG: DUF4019 domain-containing protein [Candidatus Theseobacter exili]|nr:DUF4019 domain-containing protein [Candidatus Theseobacter exili]
MNRSLQLSIICVFGLLYTISAVFSEDTKELSAIKAAQEWLAIVDAENYAESWETAADYFKNSITLQQWEQTISAARKPLGKVLYRKLKSKQLVTELPGVPDGEYVVIQYETSFENKKTAVETITPMLGKDGKWKVSGYYIR